MNDKEILKELAALSERITRLEHSIMSYAAATESYTKEHTQDIEDALCEMMEDDV